MEKQPHQKIEWKGINDLGFENNRITMLLQQCTEKEIRSFVVKKRKEEDGASAYYVYSGEFNGKLAGQEVILYYSIYREELTANLFINGEEVGHKGQERNLDAIRLYHILESYNHKKLTKN